MITKIANSLDQTQEAKSRVKQRKSEKEWLMVDETMSRQRAEAETQEEDNGFLSEDHGENEKSSMLCGLFGWTPRWLQPMANMYVFVTLVGLSYFLSQLAGKSLFSQLVSIERQFNIDSSRSGLFNSASHLGFASSVLFVGQLAPSINIPLAIGIAGIINGLLVMSPSFLELYSPYRLPQLKKTYDGQPVKDSQDDHKYLCLTSRQTQFINFPAHESSYHNASKNSNIDDIFLTISDNKDRMKDNVAFNARAYYTLLGSMFLQGFVNAFRCGVLPYIYVDNNVLDKTKTGVYLAISFILSEFTGPVGDLTNAVLSQIPVDLSDTAMSSDDPRFVSAWWLSFLVFGLLSILSAVPILLLPRHLVPVARQQAALDHAMISFAGENKRPTQYEVFSLDLEAAPSSGKMNPKQYCQVAASDVPHSDSVGENKPNGLMFTSYKSIMSVIRDFPRSLARVLKNPLYALLAAEMTVLCIPIAGVGPFYVKYIMFEYDVSMATTNMVKGLTSAITHMLGTALGAAMCTRITTRLGYLYLIVVTAILSWLITPFFIVFGCDNQNIFGLDGQFGSTSAYSVNCVCDPHQNLLSCGSDGLTYLSPCHAGCTRSNGTVFTNCIGLQGGYDSPTVTPGICDVGCFKYFIVFNLLGAAKTFIYSINNMPRHLLALRMLNPDDRAFGSAFMHFAPFLVSFPAPLLFGKWIESMCIVWSGDHCSLYNRDSIRYLIGGVDVLSSGLTVLTYVIMMFVCRWMDKRMLEKKGKV